MEINFKRLKENLTKNWLAIEYGEEKFTYREIWECINYYFELIKEITDKNIAIYIGNEPEYVIAYFLLLFSGKTIVPIYTGIQDVELKELLKYTDVKILLTSKKSFKNLKSLSPNYTIMFIDRSVRNIIPNENILGEIDNSKDKTMLLLQTSGTTSIPKRVMLTYDNILMNVNSNIIDSEITSRDKTLVVLPFVFGYCNNMQLLSHFFVGGAVHIPVENISMYPQKILEICNKYNITNTVLTPNLLYQLSNLTDVIKLNTLQKIFFGGGRTSEDIIKRLMKKFPLVEFVQTYGLTECSPRVTTLFSRRNINKLGSVGKPIKGVEIKIGEDEEVWVKGRNVMRGYYKKKEETEKILTNDGWLKTGDIGYIDGDGFLYIEGRLKNIIITGGLNVLAEEVETVLLSNNHIKECYVYGENNSRLGEIICADIVTDEEISIKSIKDFCYRYLIAYKIPHRINFVDNLEKTYNGKIKRK